MLNNQTKKLVRVVNAQILNAEKRYGKESRIVKNIYATIKKATGEDTHRFRVSSLNTESTRDMNNFVAGLSKVHNSAYLSKSGRSRIADKARETFINNHDNLEHGEKSLDKYIRLKEKLGDIAKSNIDRDMYDSVEDYKQAVADLKRQYEDMLQSESDFIILSIDNGYHGLSNKKLEQKMRNYVAKLSDPSTANATGFFFEELK